MILARAYIAIGANLGEPLKQIHQALELLASQGDLKQVSPIYRSHPVGAIKQQPDFFNLVVELATRSSPKGLLHQLLTIEAILGRRRLAPGGPRRIDLDLIAYNDLVLRSATLELPHPRAHCRDFVLKPLADIDPHWHHPVLGKKVGQLLDRIAVRGESAIYL